MSFHLARGKRWCRHVGLCCDVLRPPLSLSLFSALRSLARSLADSPIFGGFHFYVPDFRAAGLVALRATVRFGRPERATREAGGCVLFVVDLVCSQNPRQGATHGWHLPPPPCFAFHPPDSPRTQQWVCGWTRVSPPFRLMFCCFLLLRSRTYLIEADLLDAKIVRKGGR